MLVDQSNQLYETLDRYTDTIIQRKAGMFSKPFFVDLRKGIG